MVTEYTDSLIQEKLSTSLLQYVLAPLLVSFIPGRKKIIAVLFCYGLSNLSSLLYKFTEFVNVSSDLVHNFPNYRFSFL